jgi:hypothetical protein
VESTDPGATKCADEVPKLHDHILTSRRRAASSVESLERRRGSWVVFLWRSVFVYLERMFASREHGKRAWSDGSFISSGYSLPSNDVSEHGAGVSRAGR